MIVFLLFVNVLCDTLILGDGPTGLFSALQILKADPTEKVVIAEKRMSREQDVLDKTHVLSIFKELIPELCLNGGLLAGRVVCPRNVVKGRLPSEETISIKNLQMSLMQGKFVYLNV
jgi:hypothetical protein